MATVTGDCLATVSARAAGHGSMREDEWVEMTIGSSLRCSRDCGSRDAHCWLSRPWTSCRRGDDAAPGNVLASRFGKTPGRLPQIYAPRLAKPCMWKVPLWRRPHVLPGPHVLRDRLPPVAPPPLPGEVQVWLPEVEQGVVVVELTHHVRDRRALVQDVRRGKHRRVRLAHQHQEVLPGDVARLHPPGHRGPREGEQVPPRPPAGALSPAPTAALALASPRSPKPHTIASRQPHPLLLPHTSMARGAHGHSRQTVASYSRHLRPHTPASRHQNR